MGTAFGEGIPNRGVWGMPSRTFAVMHDHETNTLDDTLLDGFDRSVDTIAQSSASRALSMW